MAEKWMQNIKSTGEFSGAAKAAGMTTRQYAKHVLRSGSTASTKRKRQAVAALNMMNANKR